MSVELDVDAVGGVDFFSFDSLEEKNESQSTRFPGSIFVPPYYPAQFLNKAALDFQSQESLKTDALIRNHLDAGSAKLGSGNGGCGDKDFLVMCGHKEKATVEHETDDNGNSRTRIDVEAGYNKDDLYVKGGAWVESSNENGKSKTEGGVALETGIGF
jgi:hypothetical protein